MRTETVQLVRQAVSSEGRRACVLVNNRAEGNALLTIQVLTDQLRDTPILCGFRWPYLLHCSFRRLSLVSTDRYDLRPASPSNVVRVAESRYR